MKDVLFGLARAFLQRAWPTGDTRSATHTLQRGFRPIESNPLGAKVRVRLARPTKLQLHRTASNTGQDNGKLRSNGRTTKPAVDWVTGRRLHS